jgi:DNA-binding response OmpR family regulator
MNSWLSSDDGRALQGARILVVEDDFLLMMELEMILSEAGADSVEACSSIQQALAVAGRDGISAAVLDVRIGRDTTADVARLLTSRGTPFIFYTGQVQNDRLVREWPHCRIISKPARPKVIVDAVAALLDGGAARPAAVSSPSADRA